MNGRVEYMQGEHTDVEIDWTHMVNLRRAVYRAEYSLAGRGGAPSTAVGSEPAV